MNHKPNIAFLGLGLMGDGMARRILGAGFPLAVFNRNAEKSKPLAAAGARVASSPCDAATGAQVVVSMVADDMASRALWLGADGALAGELTCARPPLPAAATTTIPSATASSTS